MRYLSTSPRAPRWLLLFGARLATSRRDSGRRVNVVRLADDRATVCRWRGFRPRLGGADAAQAEVARWRSVRFVLPDAVGVPELSVVSVDDR